jgi:drug/metabolite transporter (DMT)-like permease
VDRGYTSTTAALTSLYSAITIMLAWTFLHERLRPANWAGVAVVLSGVFFVSL